MEKIFYFLEWINNNILWGLPMIIVILFCGIFLTIKLKFIQIKKFKYSTSITLLKTIKELKKDNRKNKNKISAFEAFSTAISGTVGTGNIVGVTGAIMLGGPGAVFWMWISAFFGMVTKYSEITLGLYFRKKEKNGEFLGGPMFYIENGLKVKWLATAFAFFTILASLGMSSVQAETIWETWSLIYDIPTWVTSIIIALLAGIVIIGGANRIGKVSSYIVPFMALLFILIALINILCNIKTIPLAILSIITSAFSSKSIIAGFTGYGIGRAMRYGFSRGIFSNEAGLGSSTIAHSNAQTIEPVEQGMWGITEVFLDTFIICTVTALFVLTSNMYAGFETKSILAMNAFTKYLGEIGVILFSIILPLFAFSTILAWAVYGGKACTYIFGEKSKIVFNVLYISFILIISFLTLNSSSELVAEFVWVISDITNALMALPNLIAIICLNKLIVRITQNYFEREKGKKIEPMISAYNKK